MGSQVLTQPSGVASLPVARSFRPSQALPTGRDMVLPRSNGALILRLIVVLLGRAMVGMVEQRRGKPDLVRVVLAEARHDAVAEPVRRHGEPERLLSSARPSSHKSRHP